MLDRAARKRLFNLCDPSEPLPPGDPRYVDLEALGARPGLGDIARRIELSDRPVCELLWATPGAGVTTELLRLGARLRDEAKLLPVHIDAERVVDLSSPIDATDLLIAIVEKTEQAVVEAGGAAPSGSVTRRFAQALKVDLSVERRLIDVVRGGAGRREEIRSEARARWSKFVGEVREELTLLDHEAHKLGHAGIIVIFDGLEKLRGITSTWQEVLDSAERLFLKGAALTTPPVHVVYTIPTGLLPRHAETVNVMPMLAVVDRAGDLDHRLVGELSGFFLDRVPTEELQEILGIRTFADRMVEIVQASAGSPREIARLLQLCVAEHPLDDRHFNRILATGAEVIRRNILASDAVCLARVHMTKELRVEGPADRETIERALMNGAIQAYQDGDLWFDLHPAVLSAPVVAAEVDKAGRGV